jgi:predicted Rossmann fold nucleotide-binding protein DprA/Smf involved in DNA uptake
VEAGEESVTIHTARFAGEQGRALGVLAPQESEKRSLQAGNENLLGEGAAPITDENSINRFVALMDEEDLDPLRR